MAETLINGGILISIFAIAAPFIFVLLVISMTTKRREKKEYHQTMDEDETKKMNDIYKGLKDLNRRIDNLETLHHKNNNKER
ncbi:MAG: hypothetical protein JEZ04_06265 [Spirochaetales bacterium]|nr:hypothetical protein [Spirochaetales bacterium]